MRVMQTLELEVELILSCRDISHLFKDYLVTCISKIMCSWQQLQMLIDSNILICNCKLEFKRSDPIVTYLYYSQMLTFLTFCNCMEL